MARLLADPNTVIPGLIRGSMKLLIEEIRLLEARIAQLEKELAELVRHSPACKESDHHPRHWATHRHCDGRGHQRRSQPLPECPPLRLLVRVDAEGIFLRQHPAPGAHLQARRPLPANAAHPWRACGIESGHGGQTGRAGDRRLKDWALKVQARTNHNKAACALANKLARICYAVLRDHEPYGKLSVREENKKTNRTAYAVAG